MKQSVTESSKDIATTYPAAVPFLEHSPYNTCRLVFLVKKLIQGERRLVESAKMLSLSAVPSTSNVKLIHPSYSMSPCIFMTGWREARSQRIRSCFWDDPEAANCPSDDTDTESMADYATEVQHRHQGGEIGRTCGPTNGGPLNARPIPCFCSMRGRSDVFSSPFQSPVMIVLPSPMKAANLMLGTSRDLPCSASQNVASSSKVKSPRAPVAIKNR